MKFLKLFSIIALSAFTMNMFASISAQVNIAVEADNSESGDQLDLYIDNANSQLVGDIPSEGAYAVNFYAVVNDMNYSIVKQASLNNLKLVFKANTKETAYTLTISDAVGDIMLVNGTDTITATKNNPYAITCEKSATIEFIVNPATVYPYTRDIATGKWGTICYPEAISEVVGATIYQFSYISGNQVAADVVNTPLEKGKAYLFLATADAQGFNYTDATQATAPADDNNGLVGTFSDIKVSTGSPYVINGNSLVPASPANVPANRAYVADLSDIPTQQAPARAGRMFFNVTTTPTGFEAVEAAPAMNGKVMMNGRLVIIRDGKMFNAQGAAL